VYTKAPTRTGKLTSLIYGRRGGGDSESGREEVKVSLKKKKGDNGDLFQREGVSGIRLTSSVRGKESVRKNIA